VPAGRRPSASPYSTGTFQVTARSHADPTRTASATVSVLSGVSVSIDSSSVARPADTTCNGASIAPLDLIHFRRHRTKGGYGVENGCREEAEARAQELLG